jgi:hypothetical protein
MSGQKCRITINLVSSNIEMARQASRLGQEENGGPE